MTKLKTEKWTLVRHSAYVKSKDPQFERGLQIAKIETELMLTKVTEAGGVIFSDYASASHYEENEMYTNGTEGVIPNAPGDFHPKLKIKGAELYIPYKKLPLDDDTLKTIFQYAKQMGVNREIWREKLYVDWSKAGQGTYFRGEWAYLQRMRNTPGMAELLSKLTYARLDKEMNKRGLSDVNV